MSEQRYGTGLKGPDMPFALNMDEDVDFDVLDSDTGFTGHHVPIHDYKTNDVLYWKSVDCGTKQCTAIVEVAIDDPNFFVTENLPCRMSTPFKWRGVDWDVMLRKNSEGLFYYFGIQDTSKLPEDFSLTPTIQVSLLDPKSGHVMSESVSLNNYDDFGKVTFSHTYAARREDTGNTQLFSQSVLDDLYSRATAFFSAQISHRNREGHLLHHAAGEDLSANGFHRPVIPLKNLEPFKIQLRVHVRIPFSKAVAPADRDSKKLCGMVGITNLGATCYLNALLQMLFHVDGFRRLVFAMPHQHERYLTSTTLGLQEVFNSLQFSHDTVDTRDLLKAFGWGSADHFMQQDVQEMMRVLLDKIEEKAKGTICDGRVKDLFGGTVRSFISCTKVDYESKREEDFYDIQLDVKGCSNMFESFERYTESELLEGENQYDAGAFGKQDAKKGVIFTKLPPVLTIHLKRFDFDLQHMDYRKIHDHFAFPTWTNLDCFLAADAPEEQLTGNDYILHSVLVHSGDFGGGHYYAYIRPTGDIKGNFDYVAEVQNMQKSAVLAAAQKKAAVLGRATEVEEEGERKAESAHERKIRLREMQARLNDVGRGGQWYKFDDDSVFAVDDEEAIDFCFGQNKKKNSINRSVASAYMLLYVRANAVPDVLRRFNQSSPEDMPESLRRRLNAEIQVKKLNRDLKHRRWLNAWILSEESLRLHEFVSPPLYLLHAKHAVELRSKVMRDSKGLRVLIEIAAQLNLSPFHICMYKTVYRKVRLPGKRLLADSLDAPYWSDKTDGKEKECMYVEVAKSADIERLGKLGDEKLVLQLWADLKQREAEWIEKLRQSLYVDTTVLFASDEGKAGISEAANAAAIENRELVHSLTIGYGIGGPDTWKLLLREVRSHLPRDVVENDIEMLERDIILMNEQMLAHLTAYSLFAAGPLVILKVFDPTHAFDSAVAANAGCYVDCPPRPKKNEEDSDSCLPERSKFLKVLAVARCDLPVPTCSRDTSETDSSGTSASENEVATHENGNGDNPNPLRNALQKFIQELPGLSPDLLANISQWLMYVTTDSLKVSDEHLVERVDKELDSIAVITIDTLARASPIPNDPVSTTYPEIDCSYEQWAKYICDRKIIKCSPLLLDGGDFTKTALLAELNHNHKYLRDGKTTEGASLVEGFLDQALPPHLCEFDLDTFADGTYKDLATFIGIRVGVPPSLILLWTEVFVDGAKPNPDEPVMDDFPSGIHYGKFPLQTGTRGFARAGRSDTYEPLNRVWFSISPFDTGNGNLTTFCISVTDARLKMWRRLLRECVHHEYEKKTSGIARKRSRSDETSAAEITSADSHLNEEDILEFVVDAEMLNRVSSGGVSINESLVLQYERSHIEHLCELTHAQRALHLMDQYVFLSTNSNANRTVGHLMKDLRVELGLPGNINDLSLNLVHLPIEACISDAVKGVLETAPKCSGIAILPGGTHAKHAVDFAFERLTSGSSILNFFSEPPQESSQDLLESEDQNTHEQVYSAIAANAPDVTTSDVFLALLDIRSTQMINGVFFHELPAKYLRGCSWTDAAVSKSWPNFRQLAVQSVNSSDVPFMDNSSSLMRSMVVQVLSVSCKDQSVFNPRSGSSCIGPFLTHIQEDDTYSRLAARIATLTGNANTSGMDLFVVSPGKGKQRICHELPRRSCRPETPLEDQGLSLEIADEDMIDEKPESQEAKTQETITSVWNAFLQFYPKYGNQTHADAKFDLLSETYMKAHKESDQEYVHYPILALSSQAFDNSEAGAEEEDENQATSTGRRPRSNSASNAVSDGLKKRKSSQIWIN